MYLKIRFLEGPALKFRILLQQFASIRAIGSSRAARLARTTACLALAISSGIAIAQNSPGKDPSRQDDQRFIKGWRLTEATNPLGGSHLAAILHTADLDKSDPRLAGLMLRCAEHGLEPVIIVVDPLPPRAKPRITLRGEGQVINLDGSIIPTGAGILLPVDGLDLANGPWARSREVGIRIENGDTIIEGAVMLSGLQEAVRAL